jgi:DNA-binding NarL/FixJ family response regulator
MRVLIVDDHPSVRRSLRETIGRGFAGAVVGEAGSAAEGLSLLQQQTWDLALLDLSLPDRAGLATVADFRRLRPALPLLVMSMHPASQYAAAAAAAGAAGYLAKGSDPDTLLAAMRAAAGADGPVARDLPDRACGQALDGASGAQGLARALHDDLGQLLAALKINLRLAADAADPEEARRRSRDAAALVDQAIASVRRLVAQLEPPP